LSKIERPPGAFLNLFFGGPVAIESTNSAGNALTRHDAKTE
jgi:hypothetical protein